MRHLVSILIPAYNAERYIAAAITSALSQTWAHKEVIVVDDGSKDRTLDIAQRYTSRGVLVISQSNQGAAAARNAAYRRSNGDYIQWLDADDLLEPQKIVHQMALLGNSPDKRVLLSGAWGRFYFRVAKAKFDPSPLWCDLTPVEWLSRKMSQGCFMQTATWLVSRELSEAAGPWNTKLLGDDDGEYFCRVLSSSKGTQFSPISRVYYRETDSGRLSHVGRSNRKLDAHFHSMRLHIDYLRTLADNEQTRAVCIQYMQRYMFYFYRVRPDIVAQLEQIASGLGGKLSPPRSPWKYYWLQKLFGWEVANWARFFFPRIKSSWLKSWDRIMFRL